MPALVLILRSYDYNMYIERLLPANLCLPSSHFINLGTMVSIWKIPPATCSNGKQNIQFQNKIPLAKKNLFKNSF